MKTWQNNCQSWHLILLKQTLNIQKAVTQVPGYEGIEMCVKPRILTLKPYQVSLSIHYCFGNKGSMVILEYGH